MTDKWLRTLNQKHDRVIYCSSDRVRSLSDIRKAVLKLQSCFQKQPSKQWVLCEEDGFLFLCAMFALLTTGKTVIVPPNIRKMTIEKLVSGGSGLIGSKSVLEKLPDIDLGMFSEFDEGGDPEFLSCDGEWGEIIFQTSGSSGDAKSICKTAEQLYAEVELFSQCWCPDISTLFLPLVTHQHIYGLSFGFLFPLVSKCKIYIPPISGVLAVTTPIVQDSRSNADNIIVITSPTMGRNASQIEMLAEAGSVARSDRNLPVSRVFCAGGKLSFEEANKIIEMFECPITEIFGSTETGAIASRMHETVSKKANPNLWELLPGINGSNNNNNKISESTGELVVWGGHVGGAASSPISSGDEVQFETASTFRFMGREDRICKIEGKRVSLENFVTTVNNYKLVKSAIACPGMNHGKEVLHCGIVLNNNGLEYFRAQGRKLVTRLIREFLLDFFDPVIVPKNFRYLLFLPENDLGKVTESNVKNTLLNFERPTTPIVLNSTVTNEVLLLDITIPPELECFDGHFDTQPIVPGVMLLSWIYHYALKLWNIKLNPGMITRLKFSQTILPGYKLKIEIEKRADSVKFAYFNADQKKLASGVVALVGDL